VRAGKEGERGQGRGRGRGRGRGVGLERVGSCQLARWRTGGDLIFFPFAVIFVSRKILIDYRCHGPSWPLNPGGTLGSCQLVLPVGLVSWRDSVIASWYCQLALLAGEIQLLPVGATR
jgi:hypothetical protein